MASTRYQPGELFRKQRLQNILDSSNLGQNSQDIDGLSETAASQPDQALIYLLVLICDFYADSPHSTLFDNQTDQHQATKLESCCQGRQRKENSICRQNLSSVRHLCFECVCVVCCVLGNHAMTSNAPYPRSPGSSNAYETNILSTRLPEVPQAPGAPHSHVNRPLE